MFTELDEAFFVFSQDLKLYCLCGIRKSSMVEWYGQCEHDQFVYIRYKHGFLSVGLADTEDGAYINAVPVATTLFAFKTSAVLTSDVLECLRWQCPDDQIVMFD